MKRTKPTGPKLKLHEPTPTPRRRMTAHDAMKTLIDHYASEERLAEAAGDRERVAVCHRRRFVLSGLLGDRASTENRRQAELWRDTEFRGRRRPG